MIGTPGVGTHRHYATSVRGFLCVAFSHPEAGAHIFFSERFSVAHSQVASGVTASISREHPSPRRFAMKGNPQIIAELNKLLKNELTAINQYFLHARMMNHWGFERLGKKVYEASIGEMQHADKVVLRILLLDCTPKLQNIDKLALSETAPSC